MSKQNLPQVELLVNKILKYKDQLETAQETLARSQDQVILWQREVEKLKKTVDILQETGLLNDAVNVLQDIEKDVQKIQTTTILQTQNIASPINQITDNEKTNLEKVLQNIKKEIIDEYMKMNRLKKAHARYHLFKKTIEELGTPLYFKDFWKRISELGDTINEKCFFSSIHRANNNPQFGFKNIGHGKFILL